MKVCPNCGGPTRASVLDPNVEFCSPCGRGEYIAIADPDKATAPTDEQIVLLADNLSTWYGGDDWAFSRESLIEFARAVRAA